MTTSAEDFKEVLRQRHLELGIKTLRALAQAAGISYETLRSLRPGRRPRDATIYGLNRALRYKDGAGIEALLNSQAPEPIAEVDEPEGELTLEQARTELAKLTAKMAELEAREERRTASG